jgi:hypothetical protein
MALDEDLNYRLADLEYVIFTVKMIDHDLYELWFLCNKLYFQLNFKVDFFDIKRSDLFGLIKENINKIKNYYSNCDDCPLENYQWMVLGKFNHMRLTAILASLVPETFEDDREEAA